MKIFALGDQGNLLKGIDNKTIKALTKQAGPNVIGLLVYSKLQVPPPLCLAWLNHKIQNQSRIQLSILQNININNFVFIPTNPSIKSKLKASEFLSRIPPTHSSLRNIAWIIFLITRISRFAHLPLLI